MTTQPDAGQLQILSNDKLGANPLTAAAPSDDVGEWFDYIGVILDALKRERDAFSSPMFPMEYLAVQGLEVWRRWPEIMVAVDEVVPAEVIGDRFRRPGLGVNPIHFFCLACLPPPGRDRWAALGRARSDDGWRARVFMDFYRRTAGAWRADGFTTSWSAGGAIRPYGADVVLPIADAARTLNAEQRTRFRRTLGAITQYSFLLNIECRIGVGDTGPYGLPKDRVLVVRELSGLGESWLPWSTVVRDVPHERIVLGLVLRPGVAVRINDIATSFASTGSLLDHVEAVSLFTSDAQGTLTPITFEDFDAAGVAVAAANRTLYRTLASYSYAEKVAAGTLVYFGMIRPWVAEAGLVDSVDWTVPRDALPVMEQIGITARGTEGDR